MKKRSLLLAALYLGIFVVAYLFIKRYGIMLSFEALMEARHEIESSLMKNPVLGAMLFSVIYISAIALSLPVATALTVLSGFLFGTILGTFIVVVSATVGAAIIFLLARYIFRDYFAKKIGDRISVVNRELTEHGFRDVLLLRLTPIVPFSFINIATALTSVRLRQYVLATAVGIVPFTFVYVQAGTRLAEIQSLSDIVSLQTVVVVSLVVVAAAIPFFIGRRRKENHSKSAHEKS